MNPAVAHSAEMHFFVSTKTYHKIQNGEKIERHRLSIIIIVRVGIKLTNASVLLRIIGNAQQLFHYCF